MSEPAREPAPEAQADVAATAPPAAAEPSAAGVAPAHHESPGRDAAGRGPDAPRPVENPFLRNLVEAMRHVAEEARSKSVAELRTTVDERIRELRSASEERAGAMRKLAEEEIAAITAWQEAEMERIRSEARRRSEDRRAQLERELDQDDRSTEQEIEATRARASDYEAQLDAFLERLADIHDPAAFVAEAERLPAPPLTSPDPDQPNTMGARLAALGVDTGVTPATRDAAPAATPAAPPAAGDGSAAPREPAEAAAGGPRVEQTDAPAETVTSVMVKGLGSFGAITSFKQSLERAPGIRSVALSLGPTGDFVYRVIHAPGSDLVTSLTALEEGSTVERHADGSLRLTVGRPR